MTNHPKCHQSWALTLTKYVLNSGEPQVANEGHQDQPYTVSKSCATSGAKKLFLFKKIGLFYPTKLHYLLIKSSFLTVSIFKHLVNF